MTPQEITNRLKVFSSLCNGDVQLIKEAATLIESQQRDLDTFKRILLAPGLLAHLRDDRTRQEFEDAMRLIKPATGSGALSK